MAPVSQPRPERGITGHPDHVTVGEATAVAFHRLRDEGTSGFRRLIRVAIPQTLLDTWNEQLVSSGREPFDLTQRYHPRGVPNETIGLVVDTSAVAARVVAALKEHKTQADEVQDMTEEEQLLMFSREHGVIDRPPPRPGEPVLRDVFDGLD